MEIASWHGHSFVVEPGLIRGFKDLSFEAAVETENTRQGTASIKSASPATAEMTAMLHAAVGCNVRAEAEGFLGDVGQSDILYIGGVRLFEANLMLKQASVREIEIVGSGNWQSCEVQLSFIQSGAAAGSGSTSEGTQKKQSAKESLSVTAQAKTKTESINAKASGKEAVKAAKAAAENTIANAREQSAIGKASTKTAAQVEYEKNSISVTLTGTTPKAATQTSPTTGKAINDILTKITNKINKKQ